MVNFVKQHWATILVILILLWKIIPFIWSNSNVIVKTLLVWISVCGGLAFATTITYRFCIWLKK